MLFLLALPVVAVVAALQRYVQCCAPSTLLTQRVRAAPASFRVFVALLAVAAVLLMVMHALSEAIDSGAPGWLHLVVLVLAWDAVKVVLLAGYSGSRVLLYAARSMVHPTLSSVPEGP